MQSLAQEIKSFSKANLRKQCTRVTTLSGRRIIETWKGSTVQVVEETVQPESACGYIQDNNWDLQVGYIKPYLLLGSQDAAHDFGTLRKYKVTHILNVAYGVENAFPDLFIYKTLSILDLPDTDIISYIEECAQFIDQAKAEGNSLGNCRHFNSISHVVDKLGDLLFHMGTFSSKLSRRNIVTVKPKESEDGRTNRDLTESQTRVIKNAVQRVSREVQRASVITEGGK
ncbi:dual specificity protein phosphatase 19-like [Sinocyclocheilus anshuiensis]|uniref:dual specificity protein phosphatase 19-like n=1 Tax=Sinocyclocheilus anshuiensis TaxID=1608454 RepID=UPI0007B959C2|nr:PREDICTED: dual specificity protein phosphatase 19-like [Sinocyclocheilus anshuiensis]